MFEIRKNFKSHYKYNVFQLNSQIFLNFFAIPKHLTIFKIKNLHISKTCINFATVIKKQYV